MNETRIRDSGKVLVAALLICGCSGGSPSAPSIPSAQRAAPLRTASASDPVAASLTSYLAGLKGFTGSVLVVRRGEVLVRFASGEADEQRQMADSPGTVYRIGSLTKQFTAALVLRLAERGVLKLDDRACRYLNPCPDIWRQITVRDLLVHLSGIGSYTALPGFSQLIGTPVTPRALVARFSGVPLKFAPETQWRYSNSGYVVLGLIIEQVTGKPYGQVLHDELLAPLGLAHSGYDAGHPAPSGLAVGYFGVGRPAEHVDPSEAFSAGGVYSTIDDLARWDRARLGLSDDDVKAAFTVQHDCAPYGCGEPADGYGYGWFVGRQNGHRIVFHPGGYDGYIAYDGYYPDDDVEVVVLSNVEGTDTQGIGRALGSLVLNGR